MTDDNEIAIWLAIKNWEEGCLNLPLCVRISVCLSTLGKGMGKRLGYDRVSTDDQRLDLQRDALTRAACADI